MYKFWQRSNIDWDISCEAKHPRREVMAAAQNQKNQKALSGGTVMFLVITAFAGGLCCSGAVTVQTLRGESFAKFAAGGICCLAVQFIFLLIAWVMVSGQASTLKERQLSLERISFVNECGDEFMTIPKSFGTQV